MLQQGVLSVALGSAREMQAVRAAAVSAIGGYGTRSNSVARTWIGCRFKTKWAVRAGARQSEERGLQPSIEGSAASEVPKGGLGFPNYLTVRRFPVQTLPSRKRGEVGCYSVGLSFMR